jgi:hypothetical protein
MILLLGFGQFELFFFDEIFLLGHVRVVLGISYDIGGTGPLKEKLVAVLVAFLAKLEPEAGDFEFGLGDGDGRCFHVWPSVNRLTVSRIFKVSIRTP